MGTLSAHSGLDADGFTYLGGEVKLYPPKGALDPPLRGLIHGKSGLISGGSGDFGPDQGGFFPDRAWDPLIKAFFRLIKP